jgi:hypothetical protein
MKNEGDTLKSPPWSGPRPGSRNSDMATSSEAGKGAKVSFPTW